MTDKQLTWVDKIINSMGPEPKDGLNLLHTRYLLLALLPMWICLNPADLLQLFTATFISLNSWDRIMYPS